MTDEEAEGYRQRLVELLSDPKCDKVEEARKLGREVGANIYSEHLWKDANAAFSELVANIHNALQTATIINMSRTSAKMCEIASRNYKIALIATIIALGSTLALWIAVCK